MFKKFKITQSGFSLIQGMILATAVAGMALVGTRLLSDQKLAVKGQQAQDKVELLHSMIYSILQNKDHCKETFSKNGLDIPPNFNPGATPAANSIFTKSNTAAIFTVNQNAGSTNYNPDLIYMNNSVSINSMAVTMDATAPIKSAKLDITYGKINSDDLGARTGKGFGGKTVKKTIQLIVQTDLSTSAFDSCYAVSQDNEESVEKFCKSITQGTSNNELFYWSEEHQKCVLRQELCPVGQIYFGFDQLGRPDCRNFLNYLSDILDPNLNNCQNLSSVGFQISGNKVSIMCSNSCTSSCDCPNANDVCEKGSCVDRTNGCIDGTYAKGDSSCQFLCNGGMWVCPVNGKPCGANATCASSCDCPNANDVCEKGSCVDRTNGCIDGTYAKGDSSCQWLCNGGLWVCPVGAQVCGAKANTCASSCDCPNANDVCEKGLCVDRSKGCVDGTYAKGDSSCQWLCNGGLWVCPVGGQVCGAKANTCTSSCDCPNANDVCENGSCVDRTKGCIDGTYAKGDNSCQWLCNGGQWVCPVGGKACNALGCATSQAEAEMSCVETYLKYAEAVGFSSNIPVNSAGTGPSAPMISFSCLDQAAASGGTKICYTYDVIGKDRCSMGILCTLPTINQSCLPEVGAAMKSCTDSGGIVLGEDLKDACLKLASTDPTISCIVYSNADPNTPCTQAVVCSNLNASCKFLDSAEANAACLKQGGTSIGELLTSECTLKSKSDPNLLCMAFMTNKCTYSVGCKTSKSACAIDKAAAASECVSSGGNPITSYPWEECLTATKGDPQLSCIAHNEAAVCDFGLLCQKQLYCCPSSGNLLTDCSSCPPLPFGQTSLCGDGGVKYLQCAQ